MGLAHRHTDAGVCVNGLRCGVLRIAEVAVGVCGSGGVDSDVLVLVQVVAQLNGGDMILLKSVLWLALVVVAFWLSFFAWHAWITSIAAAVVVGGLLQVILFNRRCV